MTEINWPAGKIVFHQGDWKCRVVTDHGESITYEPLEGVLPECRGRVFTAAKDLFKTERRKRG